MYEKDQEEAQEAEEKMQDEEGGAIEGNGSVIMQQDTSANAARSRADSGFGALGLGDHGLTAAGGVHGGGHHHGKPKYQKIPPEKYAHISSTH